VKLLPPMRFRLDPDDHEKYGSDWYTYDENTLVRLPLGELKAIEQAVGMSVPLMMDRWRGSYIDGVLAVMWTARRAAGIAEEFAAFEPVALLAEWEPAPAADADPPEDSTSSTKRAASKRSSTGTNRSSRSPRTSRRAS
jgi:hypothetical protein